MAKRIITGLILAPLLIWLVLYLPKYATVAVLAVATARCVDELLRMYPECRRIDRIFGMLLAVLLALSPLGGSTAFGLAVGLVPIAWLSLCLLRPGDVETANRRAALGMLAIGYVGVLCAMLVAIASRAHMPNVAPAHLGNLTFGPYDDGRGALLGLFAMVFAGDTGAYFAGRSFGRHKLYELISPKKTVEGAIGGLAASILAGWLTSQWLLPMPASHGLLLGAACGTVGQIGDLVESLFKRATHTKDSGTLLPGHGGLLDRLDGVLFAAPVLHAWLILT